MTNPESNTLFLRLEGPLQAWGYHSHWTVRDTGAEPTKSGVLGMVACAMGRRRGAPLDDLASLQMGVRVDRPGTVWVDYHTVGAKIGCLTAAGKIKRTQPTGEIEAVQSYRYYLCDASFLVALHGSPQTVADAAQAFQSPVWPVFLGRKSCPPAVPPFQGTGNHADLLAALCAKPWRPRLGGVDRVPDGGQLLCALETDSSDPHGQPRHDVPVSFGSRGFTARYVRQVTISVPPGSGKPTQSLCPRPRIRWPNRSSAKWEECSRDFRRRHPLCIFCKRPVEDAHHLTYEHAGMETDKDLSPVCDLCHDAVSALEYSQDLGTLRIDPACQSYRDLIRSKRDEILEKRLVADAARRRKRDVSLEADD